MSTTAFHTRRLVEHRYGRPLEHLRREVARGRSTDPVLPIVLRRLAVLDRTGAQGRTTRRTLRTVVQNALDDAGAPDDRLRHQIAELRALERQEQTHAEAVWDLLDIRLLLDQPAIGRTAIPQPPHLTGEQDLLAAAREAATGLPRLTRDSLRLALRDRGIHISNHRIGLVLQQLRNDHTR